MAIKSKIYAVPLTKGRHYGWFARPDLYGGLEADFGVKSYEPGSALPDAVEIGGKNKPPKIRFGTDGNKTYIRFIAPHKLEDAVYKRQIVGKKFNSKNICSVGIKSN